MSDLFTQTRLQEHIERCETPWQRAVLEEWGRRHPKPDQWHMGRLGFVDIVPTPCTCSRCQTPSVIVPDMNTKPEKGYVICPRCSQPKGASAIGDSPR